MNKERLEKFINETLNAPYFSSLYDIDMWREDKEELIRDLEVLEILKYGILYVSEEERLTFSPIISKEEKQIIKEWLENEK